LTKCFAGIVVALKPKIFVMENVDRIIKSKAWENAKKILKIGGYGLTEKILDASYCGCPQIRKRFFCVVFFDKPDNVLAPYIEKNISKKQMTVRDYFGDKIDTNYYYRHPRNYCRRAIYSIDEASPTIRGVNRPIPKGYPGHPGDSVNVSEIENNDVSVITVIDGRRNVQDILTKKLIELFKNFSFCKPSMA
jgi:DNA (cytosine-5)-methyltransferase 1